MMLSFIPYRNEARAAQWVVSLNGSHNTDKLVKISQALRHMNEQNAGQLTDVPLPRYEEGQSAQPHLGRPLAGDRPGQRTGGLRKTHYGRTYRSVGADDLIPYGNTEPFMEGNINSMFTYRGWGLTMSFNYRFGGQAYNATLIQKVENANLLFNADRRVLESRWKAPGDRANYKGADQRQRRLRNQSVVPVRDGRERAAFQFADTDIPYGCHQHEISKKAADQLHDLQSGNSRSVLPLDGPSRNAVWTILSPARSHYP